MKKYIAPKINIITLKTQDVITTSAGGALPTPSDIRRDVDYYFTGPDATFGTLN